MGVEISPLRSDDGTPITVSKMHGEGRAQTFDEAVVEQLSTMTQLLGKILMLLEMEFEMQGDTLDGED